MELEKIDKDLLTIVADLHQVPQGAYNIRKNGKSIGRSSSANITIETNAENSGINIIIAPNTVNESVHIPVILSESGLHDMVKNDFFVGDNSTVTIVAGCGIHNDGKLASAHNGIHRFFIGKNCNVTYIEKHYGEGTNDYKEMNPETVVEVGENSFFKMETTQIGGITNTTRLTSAILKDNSKLDINEKILTEFEQKASTKFVCDLEGNKSSAHIVSRAVAKNDSVQHFKSILNGKNDCYGHTECDCIIMDNANVYADPEVNAFNTDASLIHEAAIGKIAGEQIIKLMTLGLTEAEAQEKIVKGFLR